MSLDDVQLHYVDDFETAQDFMRWLGSRDAQGEISIDTETSGLHIGTDRVRLAQFGGRVHGWAIPWGRWNGLFAEAVRQYDGKYIMHNAKFDEGMLSHQGELSVHIPRHRIHDTMVMSHILEPHMSKGLKQQASRHIDSAAAGLQVTLGKLGNQETGEKWTWCTIPLDYAPYWQYAALDTILTTHLYDHHAPRIQQIAPKSYEIELAVTWVIANMERYGAHVDVPYARARYDDFTERVEELRKYVNREYHVGPGSNAAIVKLLQEAGHTFDKKTASGAYALDKDVLPGIDHPLARLILEYRQKQKISSTYLRHYIEDVDENDVIHPSINPLGARTSRMSMSEPNLQNLPRKSDKNEAANAVRNCITAREGNKLVLCDFDQIEMRLLAHMSRCQPMIDAFRSPDDFFVSLARQIFADDTIDKKSPRRQITKNAGYATIYGAGIPKFAKTAGIPEDSARTFFGRWDSLYPEVKQFQRLVDRTAWERDKAEGLGYVCSPYTGRRHYGDKNKYYALVNYLIQGTAAEVLKTKLLQLDAAGLGEYMVMPIHDEVIMDVPLAVADDAATALRDIMNDETMFSVPITASVSHATRWGMKTDWEI